MIKIKRSVIGLFLCLIIFLSGCGKTSPHTFDKQVLAENVITVEITYIYHSSTYQEEQLYIFKPEELSSFLEEFCALSFQYRIPPQGASYYVVKLMYNDGSFHLIGTYGGGKYNANGEFEGFGPEVTGESREGFYNLLLKYIDLDKEDCYWEDIVNNRIA